MSQLSRKEKSPDIIDKGVHGERINIPGELCQH